MFRLSTAMECVSNIHTIQTLVGNYKSSGLRVGFVPTMGALHEGHLSLIAKAQEQSDRVVVSIFVNPSQFNNAEDLAAYPRTLERDKALLEQYGVDVLFTPKTEEFYPEGYQTWIEVSSLSTLLEGAFRPGHFTGVATVVCKLFHAVPADVACFGEKDFQQLALIRQMVSDLHMPIDIVGCPTIRSDAGLALSSRNSRLSEAGKTQALVLSQAMKEVIHAYHKGERDTQALLHLGQQQLDSEAGYTSEYFVVVNDRSLVEESECHEHSRILVAGYVEGVRLIDNASICGIINQSKETSASNVQA